MISVSGNYWEEVSVNKRLVDKVKIDCNFSGLISKLIINRNFSDREIYSINNDVEFTNPFLRNKDFKIATQVLKKYIDSIYRE